MMHVSILNNSGLVQATYLQQGYHKRRVICRLGSSSSLCLERTVLSYENRLMSHVMFCAVLDV